MRRVIVFVNSSVDGFMAAPSGDLGWLVHDDEWRTYVRLAAATWSCSVEFGPSSRSSNMAW